MEIKQEQKTVKYDVWSLDVWGNETDGFDVNDRSCFDREVHFPTTYKVYNQGKPGEFSDNWPTDQQILDTLRSIGFLSDKCKLTDITIDGESDCSLYIDQADNGMPICQLEFVE